MQIVFKKVEVLNLKADLKKLKLNIGDELSLQFDDAERCHVLCTPKKTWLGQQFIVPYSGLLTFRISFKGLICIRKFGLSLFVHGLVSWES
jgi:hypothetical protein